MTPDEFCQLAQKLRELGACKVKAGDLEVVFTPVASVPARPVEAPVPVSQQKRPVLKGVSPEDALIASFQEELGDLSGKCWRGE